MAQAGWKPHRVGSRSLLGIAAIVAMRFTTDYPGRSPMVLLHVATQRQARSCVCKDRFSLSVLWDDVGLAGGSFDRFRYFLKRSVWELAADYRDPTRPESHPDGGGEQFRWGDGQDDRCPVDCRREHRHSL